MIVVPAYETMEYKDGWWVVEEFEDCGNYTYKKVRGPYSSQEEAERSIR